MNPYGVDSRNRRRCQTMPMPALRMKHRLRTTAGKAVSGLRKTTSDPVFGIIKAVMGFRSFQRRGFAKAQGGWSLACIAWHIKMLHAMTR
ncbi:transposase [Syntrophus sp. (in: bacteria)]|jgi:hypothetical protein|uniref:transposase n=1 Tax=Syntrophus sp. (in: bacteria) TaxID=48412 RepID=UPI00345E0FBE